MAQSVSYDAVCLGSSICRDLKVATERNKRTYDLRVRTRQYKVSDWVYYFNPRKMAGRQDKWRLNLLDLS